MAMKTKKLSVLTAIMAVVLGFSSCKKDLGSDSPKSDAFRNRSTTAYYDGRTLPTLTATIPNAVTANLTLTNDRVWFINGPTYVSNGATLTIQPGTFIKGIKKNSPSVPASYLVITKGANIEALGEPENPIVFTSDQGAGSRTPGDWGGVVILGESTVNKTNPKIAGIPPSQVPFTGAINYGGSIPADDSGTFKYVRIEFTGELLGLEEELNGLTLGGVGSGTELHHVQVSYGFDDGFEFFGGTVNADHLVVVGVSDDGFDFDLGYSGTIQFAVSQIDPNVVFTADPNGIESDNDAAGSSDAPSTQPKLSNFTIVGTQDQVTALLYGNWWRRNSSLRMYNSIVMGYDEAGVNFDNALGSPGVTAKFALTTADSSAFRNNIVHGFAAGVLNAPSVNYSGNTVFSGGTDPNATVLLTDPYAIASGSFGPFPDFQPVTGSPALTGAISLAALPGNWVTTTPGYRGAFPASGGNWFGTWASFAPNINPYL